MEDTQTITVEQFIEKHDLRFECNRVDSRPDGLMSDRVGMRHFKCRIFGIGDRMKNSQSMLKTRSFGLYFSQGSAHTSDPTLADVLDCLASDARGYDGRTFAEWASDYGYDTDSRQAEKTFKAIKRQAEQLKRTIGTEAYEELLYNTERL